MKKTITIFFLLIYLFNLAGNTLLVDHLIHKNNRIRLEQIDCGSYDPVQLVEIRIPLRSPYYSSSLDYERFYGNFDHDGRYFNYVMRKVINDTIFLLCLPDETGTALNHVKTTLSLAASGQCDEKNAPQKGNPVAKKNAPMPDYCQPIPCFDNRMAGPENMQRTGYVYSALYNCFIEPPVKPPSLDNWYCLNSRVGCKRIVNV